MIDEIKSEDDKKHLIQLEKRLEKRNVIEVPARIIPVLFKNPSGSKIEHFVELGKMDSLFDKLRLLDSSRIFSG